MLQLFLGLFQLGLVVLFIGLGIWAVVHVITIALNAANPSAGEPVGRVAVPRIPSLAEQMRAGLPSETAHARMHQPRRRADRAGVVAAMAGSTSAAAAIHGTASDPASEQDRIHHAWDDDDEAATTWADRDPFQSGFNPATGLPMLGRFDAAGNPYGMDHQHRSSQVTDDWLDRSGSMFSDDWTHGSSTSLFDDMQCSGGFSLFDDLHCTAGNSFSDDWHCSAGGSLSDDWHSSSSSSFDDRW